MIGHISVAIPVLLGHFFREGLLQQDTVRQAFAIQEIPYTEWLEGADMAMNENYNIQNINIKFHGEAGMLPINPDSIHMDHDMEPKVRLLCSEGKDAHLYAEVWQVLIAAKETLREAYYQANLTECPISKKKKRTAAEMDNNEDDDNASAIPLDSFHPSHLGHRQAPVYVNRPAWTDV